MAIANDTLESLKDALTERFSSPLLSSFLIAWAVWNYKFIVIVLSPNTVSQTFVLIEKLVFPTTSSILFNGLTLPLLSALVYVFLYPYPARWVYTFTLKQQKISNDLKKQISGSTLLSLEESRALREHLDDERELYERRIDALSKENQALKASTQKVPEGDKPKPAQLSNEEPALDSRVKVVMSTLASLNGVAMEDTLSRKVQLTRLERDYAIEELMHLGLMRRYSDSDGDSIVEFTQKGRKLQMKLADSESPKNTQGEAANSPDS